MCQIDQQSRYGTEVAAMSAGLLTVGELAARLGRWSADRGSLDPLTRYFTGTSRGC
jgi:hypothetical protein